MKLNDPSDMQSCIWELKKEVGNLKARQYFIIALLVATGVINFIF